ncbi:tail fiber assembly protein [Citrobacter freundii]|nr:tail fiber assembly protein [Citrobacter freundii]
MASAWARKSIPRHWCRSRMRNLPPGTVGGATTTHPALTGWEYLADHRGETVWNVKTGAEQQITVPGDYPADTTIYPPLTPYDKWNGERWVTDEAAKAAAEIAEATATKAALIKSAAAKIEPLQDAVDLDMATDGEKSRYDAWRKYRVLLTRVDTSQAPDINWPEPPED